jgi:hypothetical protein
VDNFKEINMIDPLPDPPSLAELIRNEQDHSFDGKPCKAGAMRVGNDEDEDDDEEDEDISRVNHSRLGLPDPPSLQEVFASERRRRRLRPQGTAALPAPTTNARPLYDSEALPDPPALTF